MSGIQKVVSHLVVDLKVGDVCGINHTAVLWSKNMECTDGEGRYRWKFEHFYSFLHVLNMCSTVLTWLKHLNR